ncbi:MAG: RES family NAD+ phosphorylase [Noviherbaspirillum sp.]
MKRLLRAPADAEPFTGDALPANQHDWFHVYSTATYPETRADSFNLGWGRSRFSPLTDARGEPVPTYYVASTIEGALMESMLHDVSLDPPGTFEKAQLLHYHLVHLRFPYTLRLVNLHTPYLPKLGITRTQLVDSSPRHYGETREWARAAYLQCPDAQAIAYGSRRDDSSRCLMLFGNRLTTGKFMIMSDDCLAYGPQRQLALNLMRRLGIAAL